MKTKLSEQIISTEIGRKANEILRSCVHCGFCNATCPTYQLLGNELDGPRGRIYLIKEALEGKPVTKLTQTHLDRCLTCRACETTCPSGVHYSRLLDIGRELVAKKVQRDRKSRLVRWFLVNVLSNRQWFASILSLARSVRVFLPKNLADHVKKPLKKNDSRVQTSDENKGVKQKNDQHVLLVDGCVQEVLRQDINNKAQQVLTGLGVKVSRSGEDACCGALAHHLDATEKAERLARKNIDLWWPYVCDGVHSIVSTASGCGVMIKDYGHLLSSDDVYAKKASKISQLSKDLSEVIVNLDPQPSVKNTRNKKIVFQSPCTLQHGLGIKGVVEAVLSRAGYEMGRQNDGHLCCGSAGTYSVLQPELSIQLAKNKLTNLSVDQPDIIASANIGCLMQLQKTSKVPVVHWIELL